jgi:hypothetical protein
VQNRASSIVARIKPVIINPFSHEGRFKSAKELLGKINASVSCNGSQVIEKVAFPRWKRLLSEILQHLRAIGCHHRGI